MSKNVTLLEDLRDGKKCNLEAAAAIEQLESELTALRSQVAELQRTLKYERENQIFSGRIDTWQAACGRARRESEDWEKKCAELQRQLDEAAKQEPIAIYQYRPHFMQYGVQWTQYSNNLQDGDKLYALPPNLAAMIERAVREYKEDAERYRWLRANAVNGTMEFKRDGYLNCDEPENEWDSTIDAIRARGEKA